MVLVVGPEDGVDEVSAAISRGVVPERPMPSTCSRPRRSRHDSQSCCTSHPMPSHAMPCLALPCLPACAPGSAACLETSQTRFSDQTTSHFFLTVAFSVNPRPVNTCLVCTHICFFIYLLFFCARVAVLYFIAVSLSPFRVRTTLFSLPSPLKLSTSQRALFTSCHAATSHGELIGPWVGALLSAVVRIALLPAVR